MVCVGEISLSSRRSSSRLDSERAEACGVAFAAGRESSVRSAGLQEAVHRDCSCGALKVHVAARDNLSIVNRRTALAEQLLRSTLHQVLRAGFFHADPHPGNIFAFPDGTLGLIDFGAVGRLDPIQQAAVVDILTAIVQRDVSLLRDGIERVADFTDAPSAERLERALARLLADHVRPTGTIEPSVLQDLVATLAQFGVRLPTDLVVLSRALVTLDGTLRVLAPSCPRDGRDRDDAVDNGNTHRRSQRDDP